MTTTTESLEILWDEIRSLCEKNKIQLFNGIINENENSLIVVCNFFQKQDIANFIEIFKTSNSLALIASTYKITHEEIQEAIDDLYDIQIEKKNKLNDELRKPERISFISLSFLATNSNTIYRFEIQSPLHETLFDDEGFEEDELSYDGEEDEDFDDENDFDEESHDDQSRDYNERVNQLYSPSGIEENAKEIANDSHFQKLTNFDQRIRYAKKFFAEKSKEYYDFPFFEIVNSATEIFKIEILPQIEEELSKRAQELHDLGHKKIEIA